MPTSRTLLALGGAIALLLGATACGSGSPDTSTPRSSQGPTGSTQGRTGPPGADGTVAAVEGATAQVQNPMTGQVAVTWTAATKFTKQVTTTKAAVKVGSCVMVEPVQASGSAQSGSDQSGSDDQADSDVVAAARVRITPKNNGSCIPALRGGGAGPQVKQDGGDRAAPPSGAAPGRIRSFGAFGEVTAVSGAGFTVSATVPTGTDGKTETKPVSVATSATTTYTTTATGAAADVKVGVCVHAEGAADSTGAITATTIAITPPVQGQCGGMVFRRDGGPGAGPGSGPGGASQDSAGTASTTRLS